MIVQHLIVPQTNQGTISVPPVELIIESRKKLKINRLPEQGLISMHDTKHLTGTSGKRLVNFLGYRTMSGTFVYQTFICLVI